MDEITFASHGARCAAWHLNARSDAFDRSEGRPCVVMAHGMMGTRDSGLLPYAQAFADAGLDVLLFDFRYLGASGGQPRQLVSFSAQRADYRAAIDCARRLPGVDPERIVLWGTSYSGGHVLAEAASDGRVAAAIAQVPGMDALAGARDSLERTGPLQFARLTLHGLRDAAGGLLRLEPHRVPVFGAPGSLAMATSPDAEPGFAAIAGPSYRNEACARILLYGALYRPVRYAARVRCPLLIQIAERDAVVSVDAARRTASKAAGWAEVRSYPIEHFEIYVGEGRDRAIAGQLEFLRRHLAPAGQRRMRSDSCSI
jgi:dienelactone hydrolase